MSHLNLRACSGCHKSLGSIFNASAPLKHTLQFLTRLVDLPSGHLLCTDFSADCEYFISLLKSEKKEGEVNRESNALHPSLCCALPPAVRLIHSVDKQCDLWSQFLKNTNSFQINFKIPGTNYESVSYCSSAPKW